MTRVFDSKTLLYNMMFDAKRMLDENKDPKDVVKYMKKKLQFLEDPTSGNEIRWE